jgi:hypothetical protein
MNEAEMNAQIDAEVNAQVERELQAGLARRREEVASRLRREEAARHYDRINRRDHPAGLPPTPEEQAAFDARAEAARKATAEKLAKNEERFQREEAARVAAARAGPRMQVPGSEGFTRKW